MMAENPNWWSLNGSSSSPQPSITSTDDHQNQDFPLSWGQQLLGGLASEEGRFGNTSSGPNFQHNKKMEKYWADHDQMIKNNNNENYITSNYRVAADFVKQETMMMMMPVVSSPRSSSCITTSSSSNIYLDFSSNQLQDRWTNQHILLHHSSHQGNDTSATSGASKKARVQPSSNQKPPLKVKGRKEKLGDRITALHQLVSPFGKTDTASVLLEAIGYIRFLEAQIQALSSPYLGNVSSGQSMRIHQSVTTEPPPKDLRSRGLRLVPVDCTHRINIGISDNINGADYWASSGLGAGGF